jgi:ABC-2 type transport system permease protein
MTAKDTNFSLNRVSAMVRRYWYLLRSSWPRILDLIYWPAVQMLMWGFLQMYVAQNSGYFARASGVFIGAVLLWDILFRSQLGFSRSRSSASISGRSASRWRRSSSISC